MRVKERGVPTNIHIEKDAIVYMSKDKYEKVELIKFALLHDIW